MRCGRGLGPGAHQEGLEGVDADVHRALHASLDAPGERGHVVAQEIDDFELRTVDHAPEHRGEQHHVGAGARAAQGEHGPGRSAGVDAAVGRISVRVPNVSATTTVSMLASEPIAIVTGTTNQSLP